MSVTNHAQIFEGVGVGELRAIIKERGQIAGVRFEAHHLRLLCIDSEDRLSSCLHKYSINEDRLPSLSSLQPKPTQEQIVGPVIPNPKKQGSVLIKLQ